MPPLAAKRFDLEHRRHRPPCGTPVLANAAPLFAATAASFTISEGLTAIGVPSATDASLAERFFVLSFLKADAVSLTSPLMEIQASHIGCLRKGPLEIFRERPIVAEYKHLFVRVLCDSAGSRDEDYCLS